LQTGAELVTTELREILVMMNPVAKVLGSLVSYAYVKIKGTIDFPLKRADKLFLYAEVS
jgi:hypothetical protein